jgi:hypothetical protein
MNVCELENSGARIEQQLGTYYQNGSDEIQEKRKKKEVKRKEGI